MHNWGAPNKVDDFDSGDLSGWNMYDGPGHAGKGRRSPDAASVKDGILTINGDENGKTAGMAWVDGSQKYGRWEGRVRAPKSDPTYNALLLLWPTAENFPVGGEIDFMEMTDSTRQRTNMFLHYGEDNSQEHGEVAVDATQWHNWAVEWTPDHVTAFVDGKRWWTTSKKDIFPPGPMHLCIQLDWFPKGGGDVKPSEMQVDWVRQYPLPESEKGDADDNGGSGDSKSGDSKNDDKSSDSKSGDSTSGDKKKGGSEGLLDDVLELPKRLTEGGPDPSGDSATRGPSGP
ncbi:glycoside hydrolase family 16 protein [Pseudonocardia phyllosphaerae]|uniref:glycoside hydrolase family 16 protein n=1 Tax=Pseudonocardia phyllosphaerae TaxID=3390502 RepID=UPI00397E374D